MFFHFITSVTFAHIVERNIKRLALFKKIISYFSIFTIDIFKNGKDDICNEKQTQAKNSSLFDISYLSCIEGIQREAVMISRESVPRHHVYDSRLRQTVDLLEKADGAFRRFIVDARYAHIGKDVVDHVDP